MESEKEKTFKELNIESKTIKEIKKAGLSIAIIFSKEDVKKFNLEYGDLIDLDEAKILKAKEQKQRIINN
jgi:hypothetical protein